MTILNYKKIPKPEEVLEIVKENGFLICDNVIDLSVFKKIQKFWIDRFNSIDIERLPKYDRRPNYLLGQNNFTALEDRNNEFRIKIHEFLWNDIESDTRALIIEIHQFTNLCLNREINDGLLFSKSKNALSLSVNYYAPEKGYLAPHEDTKDQEIYLWMIFNLTFKGEHFDKGGLYLIDKTGKKIDLDELASPGSVIFFNGMLTHGVDKIKSSRNIGKISVFPFNTNFLNQDSIPRLFKFLMRLNNKINTILNLNNTSKKDLF